MVIRVCVKEGRAMYFDLYGLYQDIAQYKKLYIYGMGIYSEIVVPKLLYDLDLRMKMVGYVLSDDQPQNESSKDGIPIYKISDLHIDASDSIFLIATRHYYERGIEENLKNRDYNHYIFLSHYEINDDNMFFQFKNTDFDQYCKYIVSWYEYKYSERIGGAYLEGHQRIYSEVKELFRKKSENPGNRNVKQIVFVVALMHPRFSKIIRALSDRGYEIVVLNTDKAGYSFKKYEEEICKVVDCECIEEVLFEAANLNPLLFYVRPAFQDSSIANIMLMQRDSYGKIVVDIHDIINGCYYLPPEQQWLYDIEKEALESADGVVWRYDAENLLKEKHGFQFRGKSIQFWDYCYDEFTFNEPESDAVLKLCCIDSNARCMDPPNYNDLSREGIIRCANLFDILDKIGNRDDCEYNLYISYASEQAIKELKGLQEKYGNFRFYVGYAPKEMIQSISKCDYGCRLFHVGRMPTDAECVEKGYSHLADAYEVSATNRSFDFLNAGLPVIESYDERRQTDYLKKYGVIVDMDMDNLDIEYLMENRYMYRRNVKAASRYLAISAQIDRLIDFFNAV